jgi:hypothetical protein
MHSPTAQHTPKELLCDYLKTSLLSNIFCFYDESIENDRHYSNYSTSPGSYHCVVKNHFTTRNTNICIKQELDLC